MNALKFLEFSAPSERELFCFCEFSLNLGGRPYLRRPLDICHGTRWTCPPCGCPQALELPSRGLIFCFVPHVELTDRSSLRKYERRKGDRQYSACDCAHEVKHGAQCGSEH
jgi:hypothetical protein